MGLDQYMYVIKNGVYKLKEKYDYPQDYKMIDKLFIPATEIGYWRKNYALQHYFCTECDNYTLISKNNIEILIEDIENGWGEFKCQ